MYRVELKDNPVVVTTEQEDEFLMYRVELKAHRSLKGHMFI